MTAPSERALQAAQDWADEHTIAEIETTDNGEAALILWSDEARKSLAALIDLKPKKRAKQHREQRPWQHP